MHAPYGTPIRAPFDGIAVIATNLPGGLAVRVYGPRGFVYNAHLSAFGKLGQVEGGDIIGHVGNSGDAWNTQPHDHFEWHPGGGAAVDPYSYLISSCG
jgi:murein DD-endopeptidase MepM/ murein hydrolase activator NlpD